MKSLYHPEYFSPTPECNALMDQVEELITPLINNQIDNCGVSPRELELMMMNTISFVIGEKTLLKALRLRRQLNLDKK